MFAIPELEVGKEVNFTIEVHHLRTIKTFLYARVIFKFLLAYKGVPKFM